MGFESRAISALVTKQIVTIFSKTCDKYSYSMYKRATSVTEGEVGPVKLVKAPPPSNSLLTVPRLWF